MGTADATIHFSTQTQPIYHKNFDRVSESFHKYLDEGYTLYILSDQEKQANRIRMIFEDRGDNIPFTAVNRTIHEGFADDTLRICLFTDHQLFDRFHKFNLKSDKARSGKITLFAQGAEPVLAGGLYRTYRSWRRTVRRIGTHRGER